jgi:hypothetical protein
MFAVSVGGSSNGKMWPNEHLTVQVFGLTVHEETVVAESAQGQLWGFGLSALFAVVGMLGGLAVAAVNTRRAQSDEASPRAS